MIPNGQHRRRRLLNFACEKLRTVMLAKSAIYIACPKCSVHGLRPRRRGIAKSCMSKIAFPPLWRLHFQSYGCEDSPNHQLWGSKSFWYKPTRGETAHEVIVAHSNHNDWNKCVISWNGTRLGMKFCTIGMAKQ